MEGSSVRLEFSSGSVQVSFGFGWSPHNAVTVVCCISVLRACASFRLPLLLLGFLRLLSSKKALSLKKRSACLQAIQHYVHFRPPQEQVPTSLALLEAGGSQKLAIAHINVYKVLQILLQVQTFEKHVNLLHWPSLSLSHISSHFHCRSPPWVCLLQLTRRCQKPPQ